MKSYETERLLLRPYEISDFDAVHQYSSDPENLTYMMWGPNTPEETREFIEDAIAAANSARPEEYLFAAVEKKSGRLLGGGLISVSGKVSPVFDEAESVPFAPVADKAVFEGSGSGELGWIIRRDRQKEGFGTELGGFLLWFGFAALRLHRITAHCDAENYGSRRVMENIGMRREGLFLEARPPHKKSARRFSDEYSYALLRREWINNRLST